VTGPVARLPVARRRALQRAAVVVTVLLLGAITLLGVPLRTGAAPLGIVSLQFATSPDAAERMLASWASVPRARLLWAHGLDLLLPIAYASAIGLTAMRLARGERSARGPAALASGAVIVAAVADQVENVALGFTLLLNPGWSSVLVTLVAATVKSATLVAALGALVAASIAARRGGTVRG